MTNEKVEIVVCIPLDQVANFRWIIDDYGYCLQGVMMDTMERSNPELMRIGLDRFCVRYWFTVENELAFEGVRGLAKAYKGKAFKMTEDERLLFLTK